MAMRELKLPMLKHSWATSMKNSMIRARCFFFTGCKGRTGSESMTRQSLAMKYMHNLTLMIIVNMCFGAQWAKIYWLCCRRRLSIVLLFCVSELFRSDPKWPTAAANFRTKHWWKVKVNPADLQQEPCCVNGVRLQVYKLLLLRTTYHTDLSGHQVTQSVEPVDVGLQVAGFTLPEETLKNRKRKMTWSKSVKTNSK